MTNIALNDAGSKAALMGPVRDRFSIALCCFVATVFLAASAWLTWQLGTSLYLLKRGVEVKATVTEMTFHPVRYGKNKRVIAPVTITYRFRSADGKLLTNTLERDQMQINGIFKGEPLPVLYAPAHPELNLPRSLFWDLSDLAGIILSTFAASCVAAWMARSFWHRL